MNQQKTKRIDVTAMTQSQQRELFKACITQPGFCAFIKNQTNHQTHYTFQYRN